MAASTKSSQVGAQRVDGSGWRTRRMSSDVCCRRPADGFWLLFQIAGPRPIRFTAEYDRLALVATPCCVTPRGFRCYRRPGCIAKRRRQVVYRLALCQTHASKRRLRLPPIVLPIPKSANYNGSTVCSDIGSLSQRNKIEVLTRDIHFWQNHGVREMCLQNGGEICRQCHGTRQGDVTSCALQLFPADGRKATLRRMKESAS
jgi:hypothetical protein